jgi:uncharacterized protein
MNKLRMWTVSKGYSHGSLIGSLHPVLSEVPTSHVLLSYPLGPRGWLTLFNSRDYSNRLKSLIKQDGSNVLVIYGDVDEFTGITSYKSWGQELKALNGHLQISEIQGASHFWRGGAGQALQEELHRWLP